MATDLLLLMATVLVMAGCAAGPNTPTPQATAPPLPTHNTTVYHVLKHRSHILIHVRCAGWLASVMGHEHLVTIPEI